jgi:hypothetical protein
MEAKRVRRVRRADECEGPKRTGAWVILGGAGGLDIGLDIGAESRVAGRLVVAYPRDGAGVACATLWDWTGEKSAVQTGRAGGGSYCKVSSILSRMTFAGRPISDGGWEQSIKDGGFSVLRVL